MTARSNSLLLAALAASAGVHLLLLLLVPWKPMQPRPISREMVPVRLVHVAPPVRQPLPQQRKPVQVPQPEQVVMAPEPVLEPVPQEVPSEPRSVAEPVNVSAETSSTETALMEIAVELQPQHASTAEAQEPQPAPVAAPQPSAEIAAYQAILSTLRERALKEIRYPAIARASGWKGTVIVALRVDGSGKFQQAVVRQSSGFEILDRAAAALVKKITPVPNPLGLPVSIEVPITYELK
jgi:protein TonB